MAKPTFSERFSIWLDATRLLLGGGEDAALIQQSIAEPTIGKEELTRFIKARPQDRDNCDPRIWAGTLDDDEFEHTIAQAVRLGMIINVWDTLSRNAQQVARSSFRDRYKQLPDDPLMRAVDVFMSTCRVRQHAVDVDRLEEKDQLGLGYWACAVDDTVLFDTLALITPLRGWEKRPGSPTPWLGWCTLMNRADWLERGVLAGLNIHAAQSMSDRFKSNSTSKQALLAARIEKMDHTLSAEELKDMTGRLSGSLVLGDNFNALRWAVDIRSGDCLERLLYHGVNAFEQSKSNESALDRAIAHQDWRTVHLLARHGVPMVFDENDLCASLQELAEMDFSKIKDKEMFSQACSSVARVAARERSTFEPNNQGWGDIILKCAKNPQVCPALIEGIMDMPESERWHTWQSVVTDNSDPQKKKTTRHPSMELAVVNKNSTFMKAVADKGIGLADLYMDSPTLAWVAWFTPDALNAWLDKADPKHVGVALKSELSGITMGGNALWKSDWDMPRLLSGCPEPEKVLPILVKHTNSAAAMKKIIPPAQWARVALAQARVDTVRAIEDAFGVPQVDPGTTLPGWSQVIDRPRSEALIDHLLSKGWPVDVDVDKGGPSLVLAAAEMGDAELVERLVAHGADPMRDSKRTLSLMQWLAKNENEHSDMIKAAVAAGQATWLAKHVVARPMEEDPTRDRRM